MVKEYRDDNTGKLITRAQPRSPTKGSKYTSTARLLEGFVALHHNPYLQLNLTIITYFQIHYLKITRPNLQVIGTANHGDKNFRYLYTVEKKFHVSMYSREKISHAYIQ